MQTDPAALYLKKRWMWVSCMRVCYVWMGGGDGGVVMEHLSSWEAFLSLRNAFFSPEQTGATLQADMSEQKQPNLYQPQCIMLRRSLKCSFKHACIIHHCVHMIVLYLFVLFLAVCVCVSALRVEYSARKCDSSSLSSDESELDYFLLFGKRASVGPLNMYKPTELRLCLFSAVMF